MSRNHYAEGKAPGDRKASPWKTFVEKQNTTSKKQIVTVNSAQGGVSIELWLRDIGQPETKAKTGFQHEGLC